MYDLWPNSRSGSVEEEWGNGYATSIDTLVMNGIKFLGQSAHYLWKTNTICPSSPTDKLPNNNGASTSWANSRNWLPRQIRTRIIVYNKYAVNHFAINIPIGIYFHQPNRF